MVLTEPTNHKVLVKRDVSYLRILIAGVHLLGPVATFLPGLALWLWAWDHDAVAARHGRAAFRFQLLLFVMYIIIAARVDIDVASLFITCQFTHFWHAMQAAPWRDGTGQLLEIGCTLLFCFLYASSVILSVCSAFRALDSRSAVYPKFLMFPLPSGSAK